MSSSDGMAARRGTKPTASSSQVSRQGQTQALTKPKARPSSSRGGASTPQSQQEAAQVENLILKLSFNIDFTQIDLELVQNMAKRAKRQCVEVKRELVIKPARQRPRRAALLAASHKAEKFRQSWETLAKLIEAQGKDMVQETLAAMQKTELTEETLVGIVHEIMNRFPMPFGPNSEYHEGNGQAANSMGPLYASATGSPAMGGSPMRGMASPMNRGDYGGDSDSTDSEDEVGDLKVLGLA